MRRRRGYTNTYRVIFKFPTEGGGQIILEPGKVYVATFDGDEFEKGDDRYVFRFLGYIKRDSTSSFRNEPHTWYMDIEYLAAPTLVFREKDARCEVEVNGSRHHGATYALVEQNTDLMMHLDLDYKYPGFEDALFGKEVVCNSGIISPTVHCL